MADVEQVGKFLGWMMVGSHYLITAMTFFYPLILVELMKRLYPETSIVQLNIFFWVCIILAILNIGYFKHKTTKGE